MTANTYDVVGIGNAIVDIIGRCDDAFLSKHDAVKGRMQLADAETVTRLYNAMGPAVEISGGSVANTMAGIASFGGRSAFIGRVADDEFGRIFSHDIQAVGVAYNTPAAELDIPTARCLILVTPDGERTMNTFLGVSPYLDGGAVDAATIQSASIVYLEGYLFDRPEAKAAFWQAADIATQAGRKVALSLSDAFCVDRHRAEFLDFVRSRVDILIANEREITSLYEVNSFEEAAQRASEDTAIAALTRGADGSVILARRQAPITIAADPVTQVVDTTGAGDLYAAGFLYGLASGRSLEIAGRLASLAAAEIISHLGARPEQTLADLAKARQII